LSATFTNITTYNWKVEKEMATGANANHENIRIWLKANKLTLNVTKTEYMFIASDSNLDKLWDIPYLVVGGKPINRVKASKSRTRDIC
jgi:phosphoribosyl-dephospho-CoA transferase